MFLKSFNILESCSWGFELIYTNLLYMVPLHSIPCCEAELVMVYLILKYGVQRENKNISLGPCGQIKSLQGWKNNRSNVKPHI